MQPDHESTAGASQTQPGRSARAKAGASDAHAGLDQLQALVGTLHAQVASLELENAKLRRLTGASGDNPPPAGLSLEVLDCLAARVAVVDRDGVIRFVNRAWQAFAAAHEAARADVGANYLSVCDEAHGAYAEGAADFARAVREVLRGERAVYELEYPCHDDDAQRWFTVTVTQLPVAGSCGALVVHEDVTQRKQAELELQRSRDDLERSLSARLADLQQREQELSLLSRAVRQSSEGVSIVDVHGTVTFVNRAFAQMHGYEPAEVIGRHLSVFHTPEQMPAVNDCLLQLLATGDFRGEMGHARRDGSTFFTEMHNALLRDDAGRPCAFLGTARDITAQRQAERELRLSEHRLRMIIEQAPVAVVIYGADGRIRAFNAATHRIFGVPVPQRDRFLETHNVLDDPQLEAHGVAPFVRRAYAGEPVHYPPIPYTVPQAAGQPNRLVWLEGVLYPVVDDEGELQEVVALHLDISDRRRAEQESRELQQQLFQAQKMEAVGQLAAGVAHDVNNLLTVIMGSVAQLERDLPLDQSAADALAAIAHASEQASGVTRALLTYSHKLPTHKQVTDLRQAVADTAPLLRRLLPGQIGLRIDTEGDCPMWVCADATQIQQVVMNLAVNARDALPNGGTLTVRLEAHGGEAGEGAASEARLFVCDTGVGMTPAVRERVFEPFYTTKARGHGTGLGLAIVHGIIEDHGGWVELTSELGVGTCFTVCLPGVAPPADDPDQATHAAAPPPPRETILVAEDNQFIRGMLATSLRGMGYDTLLASDGEQLLAAYAGHRDRIRLLILDLDLPRRNGWECFRLVRQRDADLPVLIVTGDHAAAADVDALGPVGLLHKPFRLDHLTQAVRELLGPARE